MENLEIKITLEKDRKTINLVDISGSKELEPLKNMFALMDYMNNEYKKENDGKESPYYNDNIELGKDKEI